MRSRLPSWLGRLLRDRFGALRKGRTHKYLRRIPTGKTSKTGRPLYRYLYRVGVAGGIANEGEIKQGAAFAVEDEGEAGHFHVTEDHGDGTVTIKHDETGKRGRLEKQALARLIQAHHVVGLTQARVSAELRHLDASAHGSPKQQARASRDLAAAKVPAQNLAALLAARFPGGYPRSHGAFLKIPSPNLDHQVREGLLKLENVIFQDAPLSRIAPKGLGRLTIHQADETLALRDALATYSLSVSLELYLNPNDTHARNPVPTIDLSSKGRGTLAHEWAHYLDNLLGIVAAAQRGVPRGKWQHHYLTTTPLSQMLDAFEPGVVHAWAKLTEAIWGKREPYLIAFEGARTDPTVREYVKYLKESDYYLNALTAENENIDRPYLSKKQEMFARAFEGYVSSFFKFGEGGGACIRGLLA